MSHLLDDDDPNMRSLALEEYKTLESTLTHQLDVVFPSLLTPQSETSHLSAILEIKSGVGGSEASLFLGEMLRMYLRLAQLRQWSTKILAKNELDSGGFKDAIVEVNGEGAYDALRWESGVHRVQRVPATESSGRVHTSTVAVIVLPFSNEVSSSEPLYEDKDIKLEVMRARGAGGQHVNKTESAVRLTHIPTGITVSMQDERSQHQNKARAYQVLKARLLDRKLTSDIENRRATRRALIRSADRSEKIRTYNYPQDRVTDHRLGLTMMNLTSVMEGDGLVDFINALQEEHDQTVMEEILLT
ncbi:release factor [Rickenella mellea]|uniref:Release factor n=1 Tax=Rickenella mellea TaxID=50990 RepID=A0A4Y7PYT3_9AGAM|nr:release factor [Rickenella mellea]